MAYKIMVHETKACAMVYLYCARDAVMCSYDHWYPDLESALEDWEIVLEYLWKFTNIKYLDDWNGIISENNPGKFIRIYVL